jgi:hypothetical protein
VVNCGMWRSVISSFLQLSAHCELVSRSLAPKVLSVFAYTLQISSKYGPYSLELLIRSWETRSVHNEGGNIRPSACYICETAE